MSSHLLWLCAYEKEKFGHIERRPREDGGLEGCVYMPRNTKDCWQTPRSREEARRLSWQVSREHGPADALILSCWPPELRINVCSFQPAVCGTLMAALWTPFSPAPAHVLPEDEGYFLAPQEDLNTFLSTVSHLQEHGNSMPPSPILASSYRGQEEWHKDRYSDTHSPCSGVDIRYPIQALQVKAQQVTYERPPVTTFHAAHPPPAFNETSLSSGTCVSWACRVLPKSHLA